MRQVSIREISIEMKAICTAILLDVVHEMARSIYDARGASNNLVLGGFAGAEIVNGGDYCGRYGVAEKGNRDDVLLRCSCRQAVAKSTAKVGGNY